MRKVILNLAISLDGYIARENGQVDWLDDLDTGGSDLGFTDFLSSCDTLIMGRNSYDVTLELGNGIWPFKTHTSYVFTSKQYEKQDNIIFTKNNVEDIIKKLQQEEGKNIWLFGGASFIKTIRDLNLVDEYIITVIPKFIGNGIHLFTPSNNEVDLQLLSVNQTNSIIQYHYKVKK